MAAPLSFFLVPFSLLSDPPPLSFFSGFSPSSLLFSTPPPPPPEPKGPERGILHPCQGRQTPTLFLFFSFSAPLLSFSFRGFSLSSFSS